MAKRPPSSCTIGRNSGGITGTASSTIISGLLPDWMKAAHDLQALDSTSLLLALAGLDLLLQFSAFGVQVNLLKQVADRLSAHAATEVLAKAVGRAETLLELAEGGLVVLDLLGLHRLEELPNVAHPLGAILDVGFGVGDIRLECLVEILDDLLALLVGDLREVDVKRVGPQVVFVVKAGLLGALKVLLTTPKLTRAVRARAPVARRRRSQEPC